MKRTVEELDSSDEPSKKRRILTDEEARSYFRVDLFNDETLKASNNSYAASKPYKHGVIDSLLDPTLLRNVRTEITTNISFTPKETDIYKIHQSGDLANLDGLDNESLALLPSLIKLRDALYSESFRQYLSEITGAGQLSGSKTDMAVNVYTPTCHLLCHDDVIGTRRVSYILYLTDPDHPWQPQWGGALRLYPTKTIKGKDGSSLLFPTTPWSLAIPPAFNQLSFFAVQPGESFHDVEEVYARSKREPEEDDGGRIRMAISGWYHIPQLGEPGYEGTRDDQENKSSLAQLQGNVNDYDLPQPQWIGHDDSIPANEDDAEHSLTEDDLNFLLQFINPRYLTPDTVEELAGSFVEDSSLRLGEFLSKQFVALLQNDMARLDRDKGSTNHWKHARPPHKHQFVFKQATKSPQPLPNARALRSPHSKLLEELFPSYAFKKWLMIATGMDLNDCHILARRFRRGIDYTLATAYEEPDPQLEVTLGMTPTSGWGADDNDDDNEEADSAAPVDTTDGQDQDNDNDDDENLGGEEEEADDDEKEGDQEEEEEEEEEEDTSENSSEPDSGVEFNDEGDEREDLPNEPADDNIDNVGGYEVYMAGEEQDGENDEPAETGVAARDQDGSNPVEPGPNKDATSSTGAGHRGRRKADPAVYGQSGDEEDSGILLSLPASWNTLNIVLRDQGTLRFVKYVSQAAKGDRWDITGVWKVEPDDDGDEEDGVDDAEVEDIDDN